MSVAGRVLVIDDDPAIGRVVSGLLERHRFEVSSVRDTALAKQAVLDRRPDLIILDFDMPKTLGPELAALLKADSRTRSIPIIFSSGMADDDHQDICRASGGAAFLPKPYGESELLDVVRSVLRTSRI